jgi:hypothetical protein
MVEKNKNIAWSMGHDITDEEVCEKLGIDIGLAGTEKMNEVAIQKVHAANIEACVAQGGTIEECTAQANKNANDAKALLAKIRAYEGAK